MMAQSLVKVTAAADICYIWCWPIKKNLEKEEVTRILIFLPSSPRPTLCVLCEYRHIFKCLTAVLTASAAVGNIYVVIFRQAGNDGSVDRSRGRQFQYQNISSISSKKVYEISIENSCQVQWFSLLSGSFGLVVLDVFSRAWTWVFLVRKSCAVHRRAETRGSTGSSGSFFISKKDLFLKKEDQVFNLPWGGVAIDPPSYSPRLKTYNISTKREDDEQEEEEDVLVSTLSRVEEAWCHCHYRDQLWFWQSTNRLTFIFDYIYSSFLLVSYSAAGHTDHGLIGFLSHHHFPIIHRRGEEEY